MIDRGRIAAIIDKEVRDSLRSSTFIIILIMPILLSLLFNFLLGSPASTSSELAVSSEGESAFVGALSANPSVSVSVFDTWDEAVDEVKSGEFPAALYIPEDFDSEVKSAAEENRSVNLYLVYDSASATRAEVAMSSINAAVEAFIGRRPAATIEAEPLRKYRPGQLMLPVWITFAVAIIGITLMATNVAEEKESGTLNALLVAPVSRFEVMFSKALFGTGLILVSVLLMTVINGVIEWSLLWLLLLSFEGSFGLVALGLLLGAVSKDQRQAGTLSTIVYLPIILPVFVLGLNPVVDAIAHVLPTYYLWHGAKVLLFSETSSWLWLDFVVLAFYSTAFLAVAAVALRRR